MAQTYNKARNISLNTTKRLYGLSGNVCANPSCRKKLITENNQIGEIAHICAASPDGPRYDPNMTDDERRSIDNLLLLCETCNNLVDHNEKDYPVSLLKQWKNNHEGFVSSDIYNTYFQNIFAKQKEGVLRKQEIDIEGNTYSSRIIASQDENVIKDEKGINCLADYLLSLAKDYKWENFPDVFIQGIGGIGKSTEVKFAYNKLLDIFSDKKNYDEYNFFPIAYFFELKNFQKDFYKKFNEKENIILFLDGLDEISGTTLIELVKYLKNIRSQYINIRFIISGRQASFDSEINDISQNKVLIELMDDFNPYDATNRKLINKFQNSAILDVISIPFYRKYLELNEDISGYKDFFEKAVLHLLDKDKQKSDYANNITAREKDKSPINKEKIIEELSTLCYKTFCNGRIVFSEQELKNSTQDDFLFVINSSLIKYGEPENISFTSNLFFEYFLARYYLKHESKIKKDFFLSSGRLNVKFVNVVSIIFNITDSKIKTISRLKKWLSKETNAYVLLTDYRTLSSQNRIESYKKIFDEYSEKGKFIYYLRWRSSFNCLSGISALNKAMCGLIPADGKEEIFEYLLGYVKKYHSEKCGQNVIGFANAVILLGLWGDEIWEGPQQEQLKDISIEIINTFLNDPLIRERTDGLLSESVVLNWYKIYGWTKDWTKKEWDNFLKQIYPKTLGFGFFENEEEFHFQLEIFNDFSNVSYVQLLAKPLCINILRSLSEDHQIAGFIPPEIDDEYESTVIHSDSEITEYMFVIRNDIFLSVDDILDIVKKLIELRVPFNSSDYKFGELKKILFKKWLSKIKAVSEKWTETIYNIISYTFDDPEGFPYYEIEPCLRFLPDSIKHNLLRKIIQNLNELKWNQKWNFCSLISLLLDTQDDEIEENLSLVKRHISESQFTALLEHIYYSVKKNHSLNQFVKPICSVKLADRMYEDAERERLLAIRKKEYIEMMSRECSLLLDASKIIEEINKIEDFLKSTSSNGRINYHLKDFEYKVIEHNIRCKINRKAKRTPIFSDFVVKFLQSFPLNGSISDSFNDARNVIRLCFSQSRNYWIGFYDCYVQSYSDEHVRRFLDKNGIIKKKVVDSMKNDILDFQKNLSACQIISLSHRNWITPFIKYVHIVLDDKLPEYVDKDKLLAIVAYKTKFLATQLTLMENKTIWGNCDSAFDWLHKVAGFDYSKIVDKALEIYPQTENLYIKMQIFSDLIEHLDCREREIVNIALEETKRVLAKPESSNAGSDFRYASLPEFWKKIDKKYLIEIIDEIPFEKYGLRHENPCLGNVIEYALKFMSIEQREKLIAKYEDSEDREIRELMRRLGSKKEILRKISEYLQGGKCVSNFRNRGTNLFGFVKKDVSLLWAYWKLFKYSMEYDSERRSVLFSIAKKGIMEHIDSKTFFVFRFLMKGLLKTRIKKGLYVESLYDFMEELEQKVYAR